MHHGHPNCVLWKIENNYAEARAELISGGVIAVFQTDRSDYTSDKMDSYVENGAVVEMPVADTEFIFSEPHWFPAKMKLLDTQK